MALIAQAVERFRGDFDRPLRMEDFAGEFGMSVSGFQHHFKTITEMSPLQFQKQVRLQEPSHLLEPKESDAARAGHRVGYEDASHFTRGIQAALRGFARARRGATAGGRRGECRRLMSGPGLGEIETSVEMLSGPCNLARGPVPYIYPM